MIAGEYMRFRRYHDVFELAANHDYFGISSRRGKPVSLWKCQYIPKHSRFSKSIDRLRVIEKSLRLAKQNTMSRQPRY